MIATYYDVLQREFAAEEGSFLLQLKCDMYWDKAAFTRLTEAMLECCRAYDLWDKNPTLMGDAYDKTKLPRWLAEGFYYLATFVRGHTSHHAWEARIARERAYFEAAYEQLDDLADWFFTGRCPRPNPSTAFPSL